MRLPLLRLPTALGTLVLALPLTGCGDEGPRLPAHVQVSEGNGQIGRVGTLLPLPIMVTVLKEDGSPAEGVRVEWAVEGDGSVLPVEAQTDADGRARARWLLGTSEGPRRATATLPGLAPAVFSAIAEPEDALPFDELIALDFATYEGSRQVVHPDFVATPAGAFGQRFHLAITPYPFGDASFENPSFFQSGRRDTWSLGNGTPNPVVLPDAGYLSDPDLVFVPEVGELWLYYRQVTSDNIVQLVRTRDGRTWSAPMEVLRAPNHQVVSPSVVRRAADDWWMFSVNAGGAGCNATITSVEVRRSPDGLHWGDPVPAALAQEGLWAWHIDVQWIPSAQAFWAIYNAKTYGGCTTPAVYLAHSGDGMTWSVVSQPVLVKGATPTLQDIVYRTTFEYDELTDALTFWFSGARYEAGRYIWGAAVERRRRAEVFGSLGEAIDIPFLPPAPAPLEDWP
ncbi:MAG TPA: hypothetical protein VMY76_17515 [Gemmatimonadales bacterium]|nr:hypothetical protein [Gemmatimonadales bacterium]